MTTTHFNPESKPQPTFGLTPRSQCATAAFIAAGLAGVIIVALGATHMLGSMGKIGFIASLAGGGTLACVAAGGLFWVVVSHCKNRKPLTQAEPPSQEAPIENRPQDVDPEHIDNLLESIDFERLENVVEGTEDEKKFHQQRLDFRKAAQNRLAKKPLPVPQMPDCKDPNFIANAKKAVRHFFSPKPPESFKTFEGAQHVCVTTDKIPGLLLKKHRGSMSMKEYLIMAENGKQICKKHKLYLLYVPPCQGVDFDESIIVQEYLKLLDGGWEAQKACYQWAIADPHLQRYIKELLRQLTIFDCLMQFGDVKYDNISLTKDGRVALFDLDDWGAVDGLTTGHSKGKDGLFNIIPLGWFDEFVDICRKYLSGKEFNELQKRLPSLKERAQNRQLKMQQLDAFYKQKQITLPTQPLVFDQTLFTEYDDQVAVFVETTIKFLNEQLSTLPLLSMVTGRKIKISLQANSEFFNEISKHPIYTSEKLYQSDLIALARKSLPALKAQGYFFSQNVNRDYAYFSVVC